MFVQAPKPGPGLMRIAFDLDGTLAEPTWPSSVIGMPIALGIQLLKAYRQQGFEVIIYTSRPASHLKAIQEWLVWFGLEKDVYDIVTGKPQAAMYIDDRARTFPEDFGKEEGENPYPPDGGRGSA